MTRDRKLSSVLNVRLDEPLARELRRIAGAQGRSESEVARALLGYGIEVSRRIEAERFSQPFEWEEDADRVSERPQMLMIDVKWREMTDWELATRGLDGFIVDEDQGGDPDA